MQAAKVKTRKEMSESELLPRLEIKPTALNEWIGVLDCPLLDMDIQRPWFW